MSIVSWLLDDILGIDPPEAPTPPPPPPPTMPKPSLDVSGLDPLGFVSDTTKKSLASYKEQPEQASSNTSDELEQLGLGFGIGV